MLDRTIYISPDGIEFDELPRLYNNISPITLSNYEQLGWTSRIETKKKAQNIVSENLKTKEKAFVANLLEHVAALELDLLTIPDLNITSLKTAAAEAGATEEQIATMASSLMTLAFDIMAETDLPWSVAWRELKSRIPEYVRELANS